jgi:hypothetical protein
MQDALTPHEVDGTTYLFSYLPPRQALALWSRLAKHLVPALAAALPKQGGIGGVLDTEVSTLNLESSAQHLATLVSQEAFAKDVDLLLTTVRSTDNAPITIEAFPGKIGHVLKIAVKALEVNFADFFAGFKAALSAGKKRAPAQTSQAE